MPFCSVERSTLLYAAFIRGVRLREPRATPKVAFCAVASRTTAKCWMSTWEMSSMWDGTVLILAFTSLACRGAEQERRRGRVSGMIRGHDWWGVAAARA